MNGRAQRLETEERDESVSGIRITSAPRAIDEDDAYFHPGGTIRSLSLTPPERVTIVNAARARRLRSWMVVGLVAVLVPLLSIGAIVGARKALAATSKATRTVHVAEETKSSVVSAKTPRSNVRGFAPDTPGPPRAPRSLGNVASPTPSRGPARHHRTTRPRR